MLCLGTSLGWAGDFTVELGANYPLSRPEGAFLNSYEIIGSSIGPRIGVKYTFDVGLTFGRESFSSVFSIKEKPNSLFEDPEENFLVITAGFNTLGWAFGDNTRYIFEIGFPESGLVTIRQDLFEGSAQDSQMIEVRGGGFSMDFGEEDFGILVSFRFISLDTKDLYGTRKDFFYNGLSLGATLRYRY